MKIRAGFVSNSSSSSFMLFMKRVDGDNMAKLKRLILESHLTVDEYDENEVANYIVHSSNGEWKNINELIAENETSINYWLGRVAEINKELHGNGLLSFYRGLLEEYKKQHKELDEAVEKGLDFAYVFEAEDHNSGIETAIESELQYKQGFLLDEFLLLSESHH